MADDPNNDWKNKISADKLFVGLQEINQGFLPNDLLKLISSYGHKKILTEREVEKLYLEAKYELLKDIEKAIKTDEDREAFEIYKDKVLGYTFDNEVGDIKSRLFRNFINYLHKQGYDYNGHIVSPSILVRKIRDIFGEKADDMIKRFKHGGMRHQFQKTPRRTF